MTENIRVRNTKTGRVGFVRRRIFESPVLNPDTLVEVEHDAKPYVPELYRPRTASEYLRGKTTKRHTEPAIDPVDAAVDAVDDTDTKDNE